MTAPWRLSVRSERSSEEREQLLETLRDLPSQLAELRREFGEFRQEFRVFRDLFLSTRQDLWERARTRWKQDEPDTSLTWGARWTGDAFLDLVCSRYQFSHTTRILEVGPGYGRLLDALLSRSLPFQNYLGIDLSESRVQRLKQKYAHDARIQFVVDDVEKFSCAPVDLAISSATFSHLFPNFLAAMASLRRSLKTGAVVCFDVSEGGGGGFQDDGVTFGRSYGQDEIRTLFDGSNFGDLYLDHVEHGRDGVTHKPVAMLFVSCKRLR